MSSHRHIRLGAGACALLLATLLVPAPAAALPSDLSCTTSGGRECYFVCVPGTVIRVSASGGSGPVYAAAYCGGQIVVSCLAYSSHCSAKHLYLGTRTDGACVSGIENTATCASDPTGLIDLG